MENEQRMIGKIYRSKGTIESTDWYQIIVKLRYQRDIIYYEARDVNNYNITWAEPKEWWEENYEEVSIKEANMDIADYIGFFSRDTEYEFLINIEDFKKDSTFLKNIERYYKEKTND